METLVMQHKNAFSFLFPFVRQKTRIFSHSCSALNKFKNYKFIAAYLNHFRRILQYQLIFRKKHSAHIFIDVSTVTYICLIGTENKPLFLFLQ